MLYNTNRKMANKQQKGTGQGEAIEKPMTPVPWLKIVILGMVLSANNCAIWIIFTMIPFMVQHFFPSLSVKELGFRAGILGSAFSAGSLFGNFLWGIASDRWGRKPALILGLFGSVFSSLLFGFTHKFWVVVLARFLWGLLNGNIGVSKTYLAEILDDSNNARGMAMYGTIGGVGRTIGPIIGGFLLFPAENHPQVFKGTIFEEYPFALPTTLVSIACAVVSILAMKFLPETLKGSYLYDENQQGALKASDKGTKYARLQTEGDEEDERLDAGELNEEEQTQALELQQFSSSKNAKADDASNSNTAIVSPIHSAAHNGHSGDGTTNSTSGNSNSNSNSNKNKAETEELSDISLLEDMLEGRSLDYLTGNGNISSISISGESKEGEGTGAEGVTSTTIGTDTGPNTDSDSGADRAAPSHELEKQKTREIRRNVGFANIVMVKTIGSNSMAFGPLKKVLEDDVPVERGRGRNSGAVSGESGHGEGDGEEEGEEEDYYDDYDDDDDNDYGEQENEGEEHPVWAASPSSAVDIRSSSFSSASASAVDGDMEDVTFALDEEEGGGKGGGGELLSSPSASDVSGVDMNINNNMTPPSKPAQRERAGKEHQSPMPLSTSSKGRTSPEGQGNRGGRRGGMRRKRNGDKGQGQGQHSPLQAPRSKRFSNGSEHYANVSGAGSYCTMVAYLLTRRQILISTLMYGLAGFYGIVMIEIFPLWVVTRIEDGGFDFKAHDIGIAMTISGIISIIGQLAIYPKLVETYGVIKTYRWACLLFAGTAFLMPVISLFNSSKPVAWVLLSAGLALMGTTQMWIYISIFTLINNSCYSYQRATVNGIGQTFAAIGRLTAPFVGANVFAWSETNNVTWPFNYSLCWYIIAAFAYYSATLVSYFPRSIQRRKREPKQKRYASAMGGGSSA